MLAATQRLHDQGTSKDLALRRGRCKGLTLHFGRPIGHRRQCTAASEQQRHHTSPLHHCQILHPFLYSDASRAVEPKNDTVSTIEGYGNGVAARGVLLSGPNTALNVRSASECRAICSGVSECMYFTWTKSGLCALLSSVRELRRDVTDQVISGTASSSQKEFLQDLLTIMAYTERKIYIGKLQQASHTLIYVCMNI